MAYIDANIFVYAAIGDVQSPKTKRAHAILKQIAHNEIRASTLSLTWDELTWVCRKVVSQEDAYEIGALFLAFRNLQILPAARETAGHANDLSI